MKRRLALLLTGILVMSLTACGGGSVSEEKSSESEFSLDSILSGEGIMDSVLGERVKDAIKEEAENEGIDISYDKDGDIIMKDEDGSVLTQNDDGSWTMEGEDGTVAQFGGEWMENEFTKQVPKPNFSMMGAAVEGDSFTVVFLGTSADEIKAYVQELKSKGFTQDEEVVEEEMMGIVMYSYSASNKAGYRVEIYSTFGTAGMTITKE